MNMCCSALLLFLVGEECEAEDSEKVTTKPFIENIPTFTPVDLSGGYGITFNCAYVSSYFTMDSQWLVIAVALALHQATLMLLCLPVFSACEGCKTGLEIDGASGSLCHTITHCVCM